jgi:membrane protein involved in colicin uptake
MIQKPKQKYLMFICFILTSMLVMGAFQNCVTLNNHKNTYSEMEAVQVHPRLAASELRRPANDVSDMIQSSQDEIQDTRSQLGEQLQNRKVANNREVAYSEDTVPKKDGMKLKLKYKHKR